MQNNHSKMHTKKEKQPFPFYPLLFGIYPVLALAANNITQIDFSTTVRSILLSLVLALVTTGILRLVMRSWTRAAFLSLLLIILFFSYGHVYNVLKNPKNPFLLLVRHRYLIIVWIGLAGLSVWLSTRKLINLLSITPILNIISILLLALPVYELARFELNSRASGATAQLRTPAPVASQPDQADPDIYYIILDAYMRTDSLKAVYGADNSAFINALTQRGFFVADCSQSNYAYTEPSLASSLNMDYLDVLGVRGNDAANRLIQSNGVRQFLSSQGYKVVAFSTGWSWSQWENADVYYNYAPNASTINAFESLFVKTTVLAAPLNAVNSRESTITGAEQHNRTLYNLEELKKVPASVNSPKFVFVHLIIPHWHYVFGPNGEFVPEGPTAGLYGQFLFDLTTPSADIPGYANAVSFIDKAMLQVVDQILANSKTPPIIIIQGDHGAFRYSQPVQRMTILNAYYLPGAEKSLYASVTPVNTFRIIFDSYFNQNYPLLEDVSRYSDPDSRWTFDIIPNQCKN
jgi:hypothetical protein